MKGLSAGPKVRSGGTTFYWVAGTLGMPGMTMTFPVAGAVLLQGVQVGDRVRVAVSQSDEGLRIERLEKLGGQP